MYPINTSCIANKRIFKLKFITFKTANHQCSINSATIRFSLCMSYFQQWCFHCVPQCSVLNGETFIHAISVHSPEHRSVPSEFKRDTKFLSMKSSDVNSRTMTRDHVSRRVYTNGSCAVRGPKKKHAPHSSLNKTDRSVFQIILVGSKLTLTQILNELKDSGCFQTSSKNHQVLSCSSFVREIR